MQAEQRPAKDAKKFEPRSGAPLWQPFVVTGPRLKDRADVTDLAPGDRYVTVDDVDDGVVVAEVSSWPRLDREGRLWWDDDPYELATPLDRMQRRVNAGRRRRGLPAPDRRIRVGDAFLVRGLTQRHRYFDDVELVLDISAAAREVAKAALYGAVASTLAAHHAELMHVTEEYAQPRPGDGVFDVRQTGDREADAPDAVSGAREPGARDTASGAGEEGST